MANSSWIGGAAAVAQVGTVQVTAYDAATTYAIIVGGVTISTIAAGSVNATATALAAAWNASTHPYCAAVTALAVTDKVQLTADTAGVPFVVTTSETAGTGTIGDYVAVTANSGPNDFGTAANWSGNVVPANTDTVIIAGWARILWGLDQSAKTFALLRIFQGNGVIGLDNAKFQTSGTASVSTASEYRQDYLKCGATICEIGVPSGTGTVTASQRIKLDFAAIQTLCTVYSSNTSSADGNYLEPVRLLGTHVGNVLHVLGGIVGIATTDQVVEVSTFATVTAGSGQESGGSAFGASSSSAKLNIGAGCTITTIQVGAATVVNFGAAVTTVNQNGGSYEARGTGTHTTVNVFAGTFTHRSSGTITTLNVDGTALLNKDPRAKTITNTVVRKGGIIRANTGVPLSVSFTNGVDVVGCALQDVTLDMGSNFTVTPTAI